jgi:hypothetical protein
MHALRLHSHCLTDGHYWLVIDLEYAINGQLSLQQSNFNNPSITTMKFIVLNVLHIYLCLLLVSEHEKLTLQADSLVKIDG